MFSHSSIGDQLIEAAGNGDREKVCALLDRGAAIDYPDQKGNTSLIEAVMKGHLETVHLLLDRGAAIYHSNKGGYTALSLVGILARYSKSHEDPHVKIADLITDVIKEQQTYEGQKKEIELVFLGEQQKAGLFYSVLSFFSNKKPSQPTVFLPNVLVEIIEDYTKPTSMTSPSRKL